MKKEIIFFLFLALFLLFPNNLTLAADRALEIVYPVIPGVPTPKYVTTGLPQYVEYIFRLAIWLIGFLIFGAVVYNGVNYLLAAGNPAKLADAKDGIVSALLGGVILLGTYIIFNTINPQMVILEQPKLPLVGGEVTPGVYLCNYNTDKFGIKISQILSDYRTGNTQQRTEAAVKLKEAMGTERGHVCKRVESSGNFQNFNFSKNPEENTWFIIPTLPKSEYDPKTTTYKNLEYNYGIVLHEKDNFGGRCLLLPLPVFLPFEVSVVNPFGSSFGEEGVTTNFHLNLKFNPNSVTLFQKLPSETGQGTVTLYNHPEFNEEVPAGEKKVAKPYTITGTEIWKVNGLTLEKDELSATTTSIKIEGPPFALLYESPNFSSEKGKCELIKSSDSNLRDNPIGRCGGVCNIVGEKGWYGYGCYPCLRSMIIVKGTVL